MPATILCADDDRNLCQILARAFQEEGYRVETAHDGESALRRIQEVAPQLVTLDVMLPRMDGFAVLEAVRRSQSPLRETPVILYSGCTFTPSYEERARRLHADAVLTKPVPLAELLRVASKQLGAGVHAQKPAGRAKKAAKELRGSFAEVSFPALLHHLHGMRATGVLQLQNGKKKKQIQLREGHPIAVKSNLVNETLGHLLVASGSITWDVLHESLLRVKRGDGLQGQILQAMHMLDAEDLSKALRNQGEEKLFEIFAWKQGRFRFLRGTRLRSANALTLKRSPGSVILEGVRTRLPIAVVDRALARWSRRFAVPNESPFYRFQDIDLDAPAQDLLASFDGRQCLADIASQTEGDRRSLYSLVTIGLLELRAEPIKSARTQRRMPPRRTPLRERRNRGVETQSPQADEGIRKELAAMAARFRDRDYFGILGVSERAGDEEIRRSYTELAKRTHPDRFIGSSDAVKRMSEEVFSLVSRAYEQVGEREARIAYLRGRRDRERDEAELEEGHRAVRAELEFQKGEVALRAKSYKKALRHFQDAVRAYPDEGEYQAYLGWALYLSNPEAPGRLKEALELVRAGRKLAPDREKPYLFLGRLYQAAGRVKVAEKMFARALQLDPDCVEALRELRLIHMRREKSKGLVRRILRR